MRKRFASLLFLAVLLGAAAPLSAQTPKLGYIESQRLIAEAPGADEARAALERDMASYRSELQELGQEIEQMFADYEQKQAMLSPDARRQREQAIREKQQAYQQRAAQLEQRAAQRQQELLEPIMERINTVINEIREEGDYAMILDASSGAVIAADPRLDLTQRVLDRLNAMARSR